VEADVNIVAAFGQHLGWCATVVLLMRLLTVVTFVADSAVQTSKSVEDTEHPL